MSTTEPTEETTPAYAQAPQSMPPKAGVPKSIKVFGLVVLALVVIGVIANDREPRSDSTTQSSASPVTSDVTVLYEVEGTTNMASITISTPGGGTSQQSDIDVPMSMKSATGGQAGMPLTFQPGEFLYISAQNSNDHGSVTCRITVDGVVVSENTSHGAYVIASCDGRS
jgi:hypothetical protein